MIKILTEIYAKEFIYSRGASLQPETLLKNDQGLFEGIFQKF